MSASLATKIVADFEQGQISRRQLVTRLMGLGAAMATLGEGVWAQEAAPPATRPAAQGASRGEQAQPAASEATFQATGLDHVALDVVDIPRSRDFYVKHLGLRVIRGDDNALFLGQGREFFLTLFRGEKPRLNHYCYAVPRFETEAAFDRLAAAGLKPRREGERLYFPDPDGLTVQIAQQRTR